MRPASDTARRDVSPLLGDTCGSISVPGLKNVFQKPSLKNVKGCVKAHAKELGVK